jgi:hypothetical protein
MSENDIFSILNNDNFEIDFNKIISNPFEKIQLQKGQSISSSFNTSPFLPSINSHLMLPFKASLITSLRDDGYFNMGCVYTSYDKIESLIKNHEDYTNQNAVIASNSVQILYELSSPNKSNFFGTFILIYIDDYPKIMHNQIISGKDVNITFLDNCNRIFPTPKSFSDLVEYYKITFEQVTNIAISKTQVTAALW